MFIFTCAKANLWAKVGLAQNKDNSFPKIRLKSLHKWKWTSGCAHEPTCLHTGARLSIRLVHLHAHLYSSPLQFHILTSRTWPRTYSCNFCWFPQIFIQLLNSAKTWVKTRLLYFSLEDRKMIFESKCWWKCDRDFFTSEDLEKNNRPPSRSCMRWSSESSKPTVMNSASYV